MKPIKHVTNTWLVALHLFPFLFLLYDAYTSGETEIGLLLPIAFFGMLFSLPSLLLCLLLFVPVLKASLTPAAKLCLWMLTVSFSIIFTTVLICQVFFDSEIVAEEAWITDCALAAALLAIVLRRKQFRHLATPQANEHEQELV